MQFHDKIVIKFSSAKKKKKKNEVQYLLFANIKL